MIYRLAYKDENRSILLKIVFWIFALVFDGSFLGLVGFLIQSDVSAYIAKKKFDSIRFGYINKKGETIIPFQYTYADSFENGFAFVQKDSVNYWIDSIGNKAKNQDRHYLKVSTQRSYYELIGGDWTTYDHHNCSEGEIKIKDSTSEGLNLVRWVRYKRTDNQGFHYIDVRWGFQDTTGKMVIPPIFLAAFSFREGLAAVIDTLRTPTQLYNMGYIDHKGKYVIPPIYTSVEDFHEGKAAVSMVTRK